MVETLRGMDDEIFLALLIPASLILAWLVAFLWDLAEYGGWRDTERRDLIDSIMASGAIEDVEAELYTLQLEREREKDLEGDDDTSRRS